MGAEKTYSTVTIRDGTRNQSIIERDHNFIPPHQIGWPCSHVLLDDVRFQIEYRSWSIDEISARFHHRLVYIHPFPNGNGRCARTMTDLLLHRSGHQRFQWGAGLEKVGEARSRYISALQAADRNDYGPLFDALGVKHE